MTKIQTLQWLGVATLILAAQGPAFQDSAASPGARAAAVEAKLPWFWSPSAEGIADIPYTYVTETKRRIQTAKGTEVAPAGGNILSMWRQLQLERIPLEWGSFLKCLKVDGREPCPAEWTTELERETDAVKAMSPEERARIDLSREERRERRRAFWLEFPTAMRFEADGANTIRFSPAPGWRPAKGPRDGMLTGISGRLRIDPASGEVSWMEYELTRDVAEPFLKLAKGAHFEMELARLADDHYVPVKLTVRRQLPGKLRGVEDSVTEYSEYRKFDSESKISFVDK